MKLSEMIKNAQEQYANATAEQKETLELIYGKQTFKPKDITERVKTFEDACTVVGVMPSEILSDYDTQDEAAYKKLKVIAQALNEGWSPDWDNSSEYKYYPWFDMRPSVGFSFVGCGSDYADSDVGSRLCYKSSELAEYAGTQFLKEYKAYMVVGND